MKGTKVLTVSAVAMYTPVISWFHRLPTHVCVSLDYMYVHAHTQTKHVASKKQ